MKPTESWTRWPVAPLNRSRLYPAHHPRSGDMRGTGRSQGTSATCHLALRARDWAAKAAGSAGVTVWNRPGAVVEGTRRFARDQVVAYPHRLNPGAGPSTWAPAARPC